MKYKNFLFDWDGSLGDSLEIWFETYKKVFAEYDKKVTYKQIGEKVVGDWDGPSRMGIENQEEFFAKMEEDLSVKLPLVKLNTGAKNLIENIKKLGGKVAVVSNSKRKYVEPAMQSNGLMNLIDVFLSKEDVKRLKPDPMMLNRAIGMVGGDPERTIMIGDTRVDIEAAKKAGMDNALYYPKRYEEYFSKKLQEDIDSKYMIRGFADLNRFLK